MTVNINAANISSVQLAAAQTPSAPSAGFVRLHHNANSRLAMRPATGNVVEFLGNTSGSGTGITFPATQDPSTDANTLDDYEEGTWTPTLTGSTGSAGGYTATIENGRYVKIGQLVFVSGGIILSNKGSWGGDVRVSLPINASTSYSFNTPMGSILLLQHSFTGVPVINLGNIGASTYLLVPLVTSASAQVNLQWSQLSASAGNFIKFSYIYEV